MNLFNKPKKPQEQAIVIQQDRLHSFIESFITTLDTKDITKIQYRKGLMYFEKWIAENNIASPNRETILQYKTLLIEQQLKPLTISAYLVAIRRFFTYLESIKAYPNIARDIKGMKRPRGFFKDTLTKDQIALLLPINKRKKSVTDLRDFAVMNLILRTGLRTIEVQRADIGDIGSDSGKTILRIWRKNRDEKDDFVILTPEAYKPILDYLKARKNPDTTLPLFVSHSNNSIDSRLTTRSIRRIVDERLQALGMKTERLSAHALRHTAATLALQNGADIMQVKDLLGHASVSTTMIYTHNINRIKEGAENFIKF